MRGHYNFLFVLYCIVYQHYSTTSAISVLLRCNSDVSFPILGYLNRAKISSGWAIGGGGRRPPSKYAPACSQLVVYDAERCDYLYLDNENCSSEVQIITSLSVNPNTC